jgi:hypothetical protein
LTQEGVNPLPFRNDVTANGEISALEKNIMDTEGGKKTNKIIHYWLGGVLNFVISIGFTYKLNPHPTTQKVINGTVDGISKQFRGFGSGAEATVRSTLEVVYMFAAGIVTTLIITPLITHQQKIAYQINKMLGKDMNVLTDEMKDNISPKTMEDKIEQELRKKVNFKHTAGDLWKMRIIMMAFFLGFDNVVDGGNKGPLNKLLEGNNLPSMRTLYWSLGMRIGSFFPKRLTGGLEKWLSDNGAGIEDIKKAGENTNNDHYTKLEETAEKLREKGVDVTKGSMVVGEAIRLALKETTYLSIMTPMMDKGTEYFRKIRVEKMKNTAVAQLKKEGIIPEGYDIIVSETGGVTLNPLQIQGTVESTSEIVAELGQEHEKPLFSKVERNTSKKPIEKSDNYKTGIDLNRRNSGTVLQPA